MKKFLQLTIGLTLVFIIVSSIFISFNPEFIRDWKFKYEKKCYCDELKFQKEILELEREQELIKQWKYN